MVYIMILKNLNPIDEIYSDVSYLTEYVYITSQYIYIEIVIQHIYYFITSFKIYFIFIMVNSY